MSVQQKTFAQQISNLCLGITQESGGLTSSSKKPDGVVYWTPSIIDSKLELVSTLKKLQIQLGAGLWTLRMYTYIVHVFLEKLNKIP